MRFGIKHLWKALSDPQLIAQEANCFFHRRGYQWDYNHNGINVFDEDWDNLILLDACRYDVFKNHAADKIPGELTSKCSRAAATPEFIRGNFAERKLHDVVYVSGNSWIFKIGDELNAQPHAVIDAKNDFEYDQKYQTNKAREAAKDYPNKRLVVHYIPPHHPFQGPMADEYLPPVDEQGSNFFRKLRNFDREKLKNIYIENLNRVLPRVQELMMDLPGKTVVSADHGELLGDRVGPIPTRVWGHPPGLYVDTLTRVPWHVHDSGERKRIVAEPPESDAIDSRTPAEIDKHLRNLGYKA